MKTIQVRITKTWHIDVPVEYGDTDESIRARALEMHDEAHEIGIPDTALVNLMPTESEQ